jgi:hypothetical protein
MKQKQRGPGDFHSEDLRKAALEYAAAGFPVFPCRNTPGDKAAH